MPDLSSDSHDEPANPALLFEPNGHMYVIHDLAVADELIEAADGVHEAFDGLGRPLRATGPDGQVTFVLASAEPAEETLRARVGYYYRAFASRHPTRIPPQESDLAAFVFAVANDEVIE
ncbi:hypothetical protein [Streptomyces sp. NRRL S-1868]|uniref:hypothetical protein n=1 Tax=Streptomyces sp. NRRL S-1868 TaxID=1463892 RepID=UPI0007C6A991|nr:hypothetical protein [Streptomyces sp. NRRL S-1868]